MIVAPASTSQSTTVQIVDDSGLAVTGLVAATFPAVTYKIAGASAAVTITLSDLAAITTAYSSGGVKEISGGYYRLDLPNTSLASAGTVTLIGDATGKHLIAPRIVVANLPADVQTIKTQAVTSTGTYSFDAQTISQSGIAGLVSGANGVRVTYIGGQTVNASAPITMPALIGTSTYNGQDTSGVGTLLNRISGALTISGGKVQAYVLSTDVLGSVNAMVTGYDTGLSPGEQVTGGTLGEVYVSAESIDIIRQDLAKAGDAMALTPTERTTLYAGVWTNTTRRLSDATLGGGGSLFTASGYTAAPTTAQMLTAFKADPVIAQGLADAAVAAGGVGQGGDPDGYAQTLTITNAVGGGLIQGATVRYMQAGLTRDSFTTGANGIASVSVVAGTYTRTIVAPGFDGLSQSVAVTADATATITMTAATTGSPTNAAPGLAN